MAGRGQRAGSGGLEDRNGWSTREQAATNLLLRRAELHLNLTHDTGVRLSQFFIFITQRDSSVPWGWEEFELWSSSSCCPPPPEVGSLSIMASVQMFATHAGPVQVVAAFLPSLAPASPPPPSRAWHGLLCLNGPQCKAVASSGNRGLGCPPPVPSCSLGFRCLSVSLVASSLLDRLVFSWLASAFCSHR